jgi:cell wall assembly regulator SMI1
MNPSPSITSQDIADAEATVGIKFPLAMRSLYLLTNGGTPNPYVYEDKNIDTVVARFLPLSTAVKTYERLVTDEQLAPQHFFPFAVDGGGDYFFIDSSTPEGAVSFYRGDTANRERMLGLGLGFDQFWSSLKAEA